MTLSWFSLFVLLLCYIQYGKCQIVSSASMEAATNALSERFARLQQYGLGVNTMMDQYQRLSYAFSTLDEMSIQALLSATTPQELVNNVSTIIKDITDESTFNSPTDTPPNCCSVSNSDTYCCHGCFGDTEDNKLLNFARNKFASSLQWAEFYVGLINGSLLQFPPSRPTNCTNVDARLIPWYTRATVGNRQREIVILLDLNADGLSGPAVDQLSQAALNVLDSLNGDTDKVGLVMVTDNKQRACPASLVSATINEREQLSRFITEKLVTNNRNYITAFADAKDFFTNSVNRDRLFLFLTDGRRSDYNGVFGNVTQGLSASIQVYTAYDASSNSFLNSLVNAKISPLSDIGNYWSSFLPENATSGNIVYSTDVNSQGVQCLSLSRKWVINGELRGVVNALLPWSKVLEGIVSAVNVRPSSYFLVTKKEGDLLYHSLFPDTIVVDVDSTTFEKTSEFSLIKDNIASTGQNESRPFNNTLLISGFNQSYIMRKLPSEYHCNRVLNELNGAGSGEVFVCLILANEDRSVTNSFLNINIQSIYRTDPTRFPVYQTNIANQPSNQSCSNYVCQYATEEKLALQLTTPNAPPSPAALISIDSYIGGNSGSKPPWIPDGTAERIAVHTMVGTVWWNRAQQYRNESAFIIRRHLATPTGIYLSLPGVQLVSSFNPQRMPWYLTSFVHGDQLALSPARQDPLGVGVIYSASYGLKGQHESSFGPGSVLSIVAADLTEESLRINIINSLMECNSTGYDCTVLTSDGYFVLRPQNSNTAPLHLTEANDYNSVTRTLLLNGILTKQGCDDIANFTINNKRFYSFSHQTNVLCFVPTGLSGGCLDFCIQHISNTNSYLLVTKRKSTCLSNAISACSYESNGEKTCGPCEIFSNSSVECPCSCTQSTCGVGTMNSFPVCPRHTDMSSNYVPANLPLQMATDIGFCSSDFCNTTVQSTCQSIQGCTWCLAQGICVPLGTCCSRDTSCCTTSAITSLPSCLQHRCTIVPTASPTTSPTTKPQDNTAAIVGGVIGSLFAIVLLLLFIACCVWYQFFRTPDSEELKAKSDFNFADVKPSSTNQTALEFQEKPPISPNGETV